MNNASPFIAVIALVVFLIVVGIAVVWVIFPFVVNAALNHITKLLLKQNELLGRISDRQNETNRALQFLVDREKQ